MGYMSSLPKLSSPKAVQSLLRARGLRPRKRWGQNFLCDENILFKIISAADLEASDAVFEIGGGLGTLSQPIAERVSDLLVVELDPDLFPILRDNLSAYPNARAIEDDVLDMDWEELFPKRERFKTLGNLPYYITAPLLERLVEQRTRIEQAIWMIQLEVAQKITASPGTRESSSLGIYIQSYCDVERVTRVSKNAFYPQPEIDSAVVRIRPLPNPRFTAKPETFNRVVRAAYGMRRKTLLKALELSPFLKLSKSLTSQILRSADIEERRRGENLTIAEFDRIALELDKLNAA